MDYREYNSEGIETFKAVTQEYAPAHEGPISIPVSLPDDQDNFTVEEIIRIAEHYFDFFCERAGSGTEIEDSSTGQTRKKRELYSNQYNSVKQYINRGLRGQPALRFPGKPKIYSRDVVSDFFRDSKNQLQFLNIKLKSDKRDVVNATGKYKDKLLASIAETEHKINQIFSSAELRKTLNESAIRFFDGRTHDDDDMEVKKAFMLEEYKKKILIQFLFESLIDLDEELLKSDIELLPSIEDGLNVTDDQLWAIFRMGDLHNYYEGNFEKILGVIKGVIAEAVKENVEEVTKAVMKQHGKSIDHG